MQRCDISQRLPPGATKDDEDLMAVARNNGVNIPAGADRGDAGGGNPAEAASDPGSSAIFTTVNNSA